jgi:hypothetical protein
MKKLVFWVILTVLTLNHSSYAGFHGLTIHSRANCGNNESITWDWGNTWWYSTSSEHYLNGKLQHTIPAEWVWGLRSAAVHWLEAKPGSGWRVVGKHWIGTNDNKARFLGQTDVVDCSIYDGWWDH